MEEHVAPIINVYWGKAEFPFEVLPAMAELGIAGLAYSGPGCPGRTFLADGFVAMELARIDASMATFMGVHGGLAMGSIHLCGSEEQKAQWLPPMARMEKIGAFGLTEPDVGSGAAGGLTTTARRLPGSGGGDSWVLHGVKKWIGNATFADVTVIWARDVDDGNVKGFLVEKDTPGFTTEKMEHKIALRAVQNAIITLDGVRVPESMRLQRASSFRDTANVLRMTRASVAWQAVGCGRGAYEHALRYSTKREQFSLAKAFCTVKARETVGLARELLGGNGILLEHDVGRFVADAEAIYSYEGTREINTLIVGRAITGLSAFV
jgi:glutaryl-CoA dehydrogenase